MSYFVIINTPPYIYFKAYTQEILMLIKSLEFNLNFRAKDVSLTSYQSLAALSSVIDRC